MAELRFSSGGGGPSLPVNVASGGTGVTSITASKALVSNADSTIIASATTATELGYVAGATSNIQAQINTKMASPTWSNFTPTITLVGGAGNAVPQFANTAARYSQIGKTVFVEVAMSGDGGTEGAGTGTFSVALPVAASANFASDSGFGLVVPCGYWFNNTSESLIGFLIAPSGTVVSFRRQTSATAMLGVTGADFNSTTRGIRFNFQYEVD